MSILPISKDTIRYGSADGGKTIHCDDESKTTRVSNIGGSVLTLDLTRMMEAAGSAMNLKAHVVTGLEENVTIRGPGDIEGHLGNKFVDFLPPSFPSSSPSLPPLGMDGKYYVVDFGRTFPPEALITVMRCSLSLTFI